MNLQSHPLWAILYYYQVSHIIIKFPILLSSFPYYYQVSHIIIKFPILLSSFPYYYQVSHIIIKFLNAVGEKDNLCKVMNDWNVIVYVR